MARRLGLLLVVLLIGIIVFLVLRKNGTVNAEAKYDGVHLCSPSQQQAATLAAKPAPTPPPRSTPTSSEVFDSSGPLFAQNSPIWGREVYDTGDKQDVGCGTTIEQCGCAMTSVATVLSLFEILSTPGGASLNPSTLNSWFNQGAALTGGGWVSQGYSFGGVVWTAVNSFSGAIPSTDEKRTVRFAGWGTGSEDEIRAQLAKGNPIVLEVPGHYIAAIGMQGDQILINDPYYQDTRTTLSAYAGRVRSSRIYEPSSSLGAIMITVPANQRVKVTDSAGREVGTLSGKTPPDAQKLSAAEIPGSAFRFEEAWRDPTCTEKPPKDGQGVNSIFIPNPRDGTYKVEILSPNGRTTQVGVYVYDADGNLKMEERDGGKRLQFDVIYGSGGGGGGTQPTPTPTATATPTETSTPEAVAPAAATATPTRAAAPPTDTPPGPTDTPVPPTDTPAPPTLTPTATITSTPAPRMQVSPLITTLQPFGIGQTCVTRISWTASGDPNGTVELLRDQVPIATRPPGAFTYEDPFRVGTLTYQVRATNSNNTSVTLSPPAQVSPWCLNKYVASEGDGWVDHSWNVDGNVSCSTSIFVASGGALVKSGLPCKGQYRDEELYYYCDYRIQVTVAGQTVSYTAHVQNCSIGIP